MKGCIKMKNFVIRLTIIVVAVALFAGAFYTCCIAGYMCILSSDVAEAELRAASGDYHMRAAADAIYLEVSEARQELYFGGGYKSWFSYTLPKFFQILGVIGALAVMFFEAWVVYELYEDYKQRKEIRRMRELERQRLLYYISKAKYYPIGGQVRTSRR